MFSRGEISITTDGRGGKIDVDWGERGPFFSTGTSELPTVQPDNIEKGTDGSDGAGYLLMHAYF